MRTQIPFAGTGVELCSANVSGTGGSVIGQYFNLSLVTVPGDFAKVTRPSSLLVFKVVNGMVARCNNMAAVTSNKTQIARTWKGLQHLGSVI